MYTSVHLKVEWNKGSCTWKAVGVGYSEALGILRQTQGIAILESLLSYVASIFPLSTLKLMLGTSKRRTCIQYSFYICTEAVSKLSVI